MSKPLGRTFHGCLTCRKRKVRCKGGDPCQNCSRMNIACHGSFDDNIRMSFVNHPGQKDDGSASGQSKTNTTPPGNSAAGESLVSAPSPSLILDDDDQCISSTSAATQQQSSQPRVFDAFASLDPAQDRTLSFAGGYSDIESFCISNMWDFDFSFGIFPAQDTTFLDSQEEVSHADQSQTGTNDNLYDGQRETALPISPMLASYSDVPEPASKTPAMQEWTPHRRKRAKATPSATRGDAFYLGHYEKCIGTWAYSLKEDGKANYLRVIIDFIRSHQCNVESPFRLAVLAWTAKHWQMTCETGDLTWKEYYWRATAGIEALQSNSLEHSAMSTSASARPIISSKAEAIICSTLFLCRCDVLNDNIVSIRDHLDSLKERLSLYLQDVSLSAFASQILLWLGYLHVRISIFSILTPCDGAVATTLLDAIAGHPDYKQICSQSHMFLSEALGSSYPPEERQQDVEKLPVSVRTLETFRLMSSMLQFRSWRFLAGQTSDSSSQQELASAKIAAIDLDIRRMEAEFALAMATNASATALRLASQHTPTQPASSSHVTLGPTGVYSPASLADTKSSSSRPPMSRASLQWLSCYAVFLSAKILWSRIRHPDMRSEESAAEAVRSIMNIALYLQQTHRTRTATSPSWLKIPRSMLWPLPLFMAGIETTDAIYADWIRAFMDEVSSSGNRAGASSGYCKDEKNTNGGWISSVSGGKRVQVLMARVREMQDMMGTRVDVESVMNGMNRGNGAFVL